MSNKLNRIAFILFFPVFLFLAPVANAANVLINEISPLPDDNYDWVELYAIETTDISGWKLADAAGVFETIAQGTVLNTGSFKVFTQYQRFDNSGDTIYLRNQIDAEIDKISYGGNNEVCIPSSNGTIARIPDGGNTYDRVSTPTKEASNNSSTIYACPSPTPLPTSTPTSTPNPTNTPTPTPTPTNVPTSTPTSTPKPTITPTKKPTPTPKDYTKENELLKAQADVSQFRYEDDKSDTKVLGSATDSEVQNESISPYAYVLFGLGILFIGVSAFLFIRNKRHEKES